MDSLTILFLAANPAEMDPLQLGQESRSIDLALRTTKFRDRFELEDHWAVQPQDLQELLLRYEPDIVHFSGHGVESNQIVLVDSGNHAAPVSSKSLSELFGHFAASVRCVVLNACYSDDQAHEIAQTVDCVIGIADTLADEDAIAFSAAFYRSLGYGTSVQRAFDLARNEVALRSGDSVFEPCLIALRDDPANTYLIEPGVVGAMNEAPVDIPSVQLEESERDESHPALQQMANRTGLMMYIVLALLALGMFLLIVLPLLLS